MLALAPCILALALACINSKHIVTTAAATVGDRSAIQVFSASTATNHVPDSRQTIRIEPVQISVLTVTQFIIVGGDMHETRASSTATSITRADRASSLPKSVVSDPGANTTSYRWAKWFVKLIYALKAIAMALFSYILVPAWVSLLWVARVLLLRPAVLIYLLFLERPFQAVISLFMWILPLLSFAIATTIFGALIGGTFGWISAVAVGFIKAPAESSDSRGITWSEQPPGTTAVTKSHSQATLGVAGPPKSEGVAAEGPMIVGCAQPSHEPEMWTRRRRSRNVYATATSTLT